MRHHPVSPIELVHQLRHDDLGDPGAKRSVGRAGAAVVHRRRAPREELAVGLRTNEEDVARRLQRAQTRPALRDEGANLRAADRLKDSLGRLLGVGIGISE
jgi:hypothetical protein